MRLVKTRKSTEDITVNLDKLNSIRQIELDDKHEGGTIYRIIFNYNYSVKIYGGKLQAGFTYWDFDTKEECDDVFEKIVGMNPEWIIHENTIIDPTKISSIKYDYKKLRIILNFSNAKKLENRGEEYSDIEKTTEDSIYLHFMNMYELGNFKDLFIDPLVLEL